MSKIVIIGGVAGGASAAARARRLSEDAEIIMFERGPFVSLVNYMMGDIFTKIANPLRKCTNRLCVFVIAWLLGDGK
ncbi:hypothetical protein [Vibrio rotiferianus]|uniref:hypothetical protein n=1 Tax=Vibrio rotiferianus TaxID=190895 RepID=UPI0038B3F8AD